MPEIKRIGIAVVLHQGACLVGTRGPAIPLAGFAEFPGGKCLPEEAFAACAERECREETGLHVVAQTLLHETRHTYPHGVVDLQFWQCEPVVTGEALAQVAQHGFRWVARERLPELPFPEANAPLIERLSSGN